MGKQVKVKQGSNKRSASDDKYMDLLMEGLDAATALMRCNTKRCPKESTAYAQESKALGAKLLQLFQKLDKLDKQLAAKKLPLAQYTKQSKELQLKLQQAQDALKTSAVAKALYNCSVDQCQTQNREQLSAVGKVLAVDCKKYKTKEACGGVQLIKGALSKKTLDADTVVAITKKIPLRLSK